MLWRSTDVSDSQRAKKRHDPLRDPRWRIAKRTGHELIKTRGRRAGSEPVDGLPDVRDGDVIRRSRKTVAAVNALVRDD
jgi:hypothetical protein